MPDEFAAQSWHAIKFGFFGAFYLAWTALCCIAIMLLAVFYFPARLILWLWNFFCEELQT